jgi:hypothetical protein
LRSGGNSAARNSGSVRALTHSSSAARNGGPDIAVWIAATTCGSASGPGSIRSAAERNSSSRWSAMWWMAATSRSAFEPKWCDSAPRDRFTRSWTRCVVVPA